jgi:hypothetical protein
MPRLAISYANTIIYKIVCNDLTITDTYVGHTTDFTSRKKKHKDNAKVLNLKVYKEIRENGGWDNYSMVEVEKYPCKDKNEARSRERYWYEILNSQLNMIFPQRSKQEYYETHREANKELLHQYYENNKVKIIMHTKENYAKNREAKILYQKMRYDEKTKEILEKKKAYYDKNIEKIKAKSKEVFLCDCGRKISVGGKFLHSKRQVHVKYLESLQTL